MSPRTSVHRAFNRQPLSTRVAVVVAGPAFNFLFAILAYWCMYMIGVDGLRPIVAETVPGSVAEQAGFQPGDEMESVQARRWRRGSRRCNRSSPPRLTKEGFEVEVVDASGRAARTRHRPRSDRCRRSDPRPVLPADRFAPAQPALPAVIGRVEQRAVLRSGTVFSRAIEWSRQPEKPSEVGRTWCVSCASGRARCSSSSSSAMASNRGFG